MLAYRLVAHGIGGRTVRELNEGPDAVSDGMDVEEFLTWAAYFSLEPPLETRSDAHVAMLMAQRFNMNRKKGTTAKKPAEFMPRWYREPRRKRTAPQSAEQMRRAMMLQIIALGGDLEELAD